MKWRHRCAPEWLEARKDVITATELIGLLPAWRKSVKLGNGAKDAIVGLWAEKSSDQYPDVESWDWAARGHCMEPYAVDDWNKNFPSDGKMYHWDDIVIKNGDIGLGFSPDALDIKPPWMDHPGADNYSLEFENGQLSGNGFLCEGPKKLLEIKSYSPKKHALNCLKVSDHDERWQIAVAMMVCDTIESGDLVFYNPSFPTCQMMPIMYTRAMLAKEIEDLGKVLEWYKAGLGIIKGTIGNGLGYSSMYTEKQIWEESCSGDGFTV